MSREKPEGARRSVHTRPWMKRATLDELQGRVDRQPRVSAEGLTLPAAAADMAGDTLIDLRRYLRPDPVRA